MRGFTGDYMRDYFMAWCIDYGESSGKLFISEPHP